MTKRLFILMASVALLASCQRELDHAGAPEIKATVEEEPETRTSISVNSSGTGTIYWSPSDKIDVFFGTKKATYTSQNTSNARTATFKTSSSISGSDLSSTNIWGLYPSNSSSSCNGSAISTTLPSTQYGVAGTFDNDLFPAIAHGTSTSLQFYNVCGGIKFNMVYDDIKKVTFRGNNNENVAGTVSITFVNGMPKATVTSGVKEITLTPKSGSTFTQGVNYYITLLPGTFSRGFTMTFTTTDDTVGTFVYSDSPVTIKRSVFSKKNGLDSYASFGDGSSYFLEVDMGDFAFSCDGDLLQLEGNYIPDRLGMTIDSFNRTYPEFDASYDPDNDTFGNVIYYPYTGELSWSVSAEEIWSIASDSDIYGAWPLVTHNVAFVAANGAEVVVTLKAEVAPVSPYRISTDMYLNGCWDQNRAFTRYNSVTPKSGDTDGSNCVFHNSINASFNTDFYGVIDLSGISQPGLELTDIRYFFSNEMENITKIGNYKVTFSIRDGYPGETRTDVNGTTFDVEGYNTILMAEIDGVETEIAYISNYSDEIQCNPSVVALVKDSNPYHPAKQLLNTDEFYVLLGAKGMIGGDERFEVNLWWPESVSSGQWVDYFRANYIQPVKVSSLAADDFIDSVDFGQEGSYITIKSLVAPREWRLDDTTASGYREFGKKEGDPNYNYWDYYDVASISIDPSGVFCDLTSNGNVPATIIITVMSKSELLYAIDDPVVMSKIEAIDDGGFGFLTYRNKGSAFATDFNLYIPVMFEYGWGVILPDEPIAVHVQSVM